MGYKLNQNSKVYQLVYYSGNGYLVLANSLEKEKLQQIIDDVKDYHQKFCDFCFSQSSNDDVWEKLEEIKANHPLLKYKEIDEDIIYDGFHYDDNDFFTTLAMIEKALEIQEYDLI